MVFLSVSVLAPNVISYFIIIIISLTVPIESVPQEFEFETSNNNQPVRDINGLKEILKRKNDNPASELLTVSQGHQVYIFFFKLTLNFYLHKS